MVSSADTGPIRNLYERILIAWNQRDAAAMAACFEDDGNLVGFDGSQVASRVAVEAHLRPIFASHPTPPYVAKVREIRMLRADVGILRAFAGMVPPGSSAINPALNNSSDHVSVPVNELSKHHTVLQAGFIGVHLAAGEVIYQRLSAHSSAAT